MDLQQQFKNAGQEFQPTLKTVRVSKTTLLAKLKENRAKHVADFAVAVEGYRIEVILMVKEAAKKLRQDSKAFDGGLYLAETPPGNYTSEYDKVIATLDMSLDDQFYLTEHDISCYILDNWNWKAAFAGSVTKYMNNVR